MIHKVIDVISDKPDDLYIPLSDHNIIIMNNENMDQSFMSWNILMQAEQFDVATKGYHANNGFNYSETQEEYITRLDHIASKIAQTVAENSNLSVIALQEAPCKGIDKAIFLNALKTYLSDDWEINENLIMPCSNLGGTGNITIYNKSYYKLHVSYPLSHDYIQAGRVQSTVLIANDSGEFRIDNVHMKWGVNFDKEIKFILNSNITEHGIILGDFNSRITESYAELFNEFQDLYVYCVENGNIVYGDNGHFLDSVDGFIYY